MIRHALPAPTVELIRSVRQVGELMDETAQRLERDHGSRQSIACAKVCAATCYQAAHRIEALATLVEEIAPIVDPRITPRKRGAK